ncbi:major facilitator superfamily transporter [Xylariales sp. PMI_506]|nr:major facilitator superfamily transporter [Xylariales sp. PMI_506]
MEQPQLQQTLQISKARAVTVIATLAGVNFLNTMGSGILIAALPRIASDVGLDQSLILWPAVVYALSAGCLLLILGAVADVVGAKRMWVTGSFCFAALTVGMGVARTALEVILLRTALGIAISMCLPTAVSLITHTFPRGPWRNAAFAMNGVGSPLGYALGLVLGGVFTDTVGWRWAYYMMAMINGVLSVASVWSLPSDADMERQRRAVAAPQGQQPVEEEASFFTRLAAIDWVGAVIVSVAMGILLYVLAVTSSSYTSLGLAQNAALLAVSLALLACFPVWEHFRAKKGLVPLIPNSLWRNEAFTSICVSVFFGWAALNGIEYFTTLYFQEVEQMSALQSSLRFIPHPITGALTNVVIAFLISRVKVRNLAVASGLIALIAPILMATINVGENYWFAPFWALALSPINADVMFTASNLVISDAFPPHLQSLAGGVFNEITQFGNSVGLAATAAIAASITEHAEKGSSASSVDTLMLGYRAAFWTIAAGAGMVVVTSWFGLRKGGTVGRKQD